jgi:hypothetical protein
VSVGIEEPKLIHAKDLEFIEPNGFKKIPTPHVDEAWRKDSTGSTISFLSECDPTTDTNLQQLQMSVLRDIRNSNTISEEDIDFNKRTAKRSYVKGNVDGIDIEMDLLVFKKNNCNFILTYIGLPENFKSDQREFQIFIDRFRVP